MAFDGITIACLVKELSDKLTGGRIYKIAQPEADELLLTIKTNSGQYRLVLSASASLPLVYLTETNKQSPFTAPNFCMLLRKHLQNGRIVEISQPGLERIIHIVIEHLDELGDLRRKTLIIELMGKHSNIIFVNEEQMILDSIKHISGLVSSVREVLPGRTYFIAETQEKHDPLTAPTEVMPGLLATKPMPVFKALYTTFTGFSPIMAQELCHRAGVDGDLPTAGLTESDYDSLCTAFQTMISDIKAGYFQPVIAYKGEEPADFGVFPFTIYPKDAQKKFDSISALLQEFYAEKNTLTRIRQKSVDLRKIVQTALERNVKKYDLQITQMKDTEKKDKFRLYGEMITAYGYNVKQGSKSFEALNYYTNEMMTIPLDPTIPVMDNAKKYFDKYAKLKRTYEALSTLTEEVKAEIAHLESISTALDMALKEEDLTEIKEELIQTGYIKRHGGQKKAKVTSKPYHYISSDGYDIYVGKNNLQNDFITFQMATGNDWWFHAKGVPGSHVLVRTNGETDMPDHTFEEAGRLAAYYSKNRGQDKIEIDYIQKKHVKKPASAKPGFVVYYTNYSLMIDSDISGIPEAGTQTPKS
ncbi:MAG: NFACT family protein [Lachnospiraceae bacterium]|nr:NFACT family protein [Lachnospiraceae bacterium]